jgi:hypothetical protein
VSEQPHDRRREFLERLKYMLGEERCLKFLEMADSGELEKLRERFCELLESEELDRWLGQFEFKREFTGISSRN